MTSTTFAAAGGSPSAAYLAWCHKHRRALLLTAAGTAAAYGLYQLSQTEQAARVHAQLTKLKQALVEYGAAATAMGGTVALVSSDLNTYISSGSNELPQSLRQLSKLLQSTEMQETLETGVASVVRGVSQAAAATAVPGEPSVPPLVDTLLEAVLSERGRGLVGMAVGMASRNATAAFCDFLAARQAAAAAAAAQAEEEGVEGASNGFGLRDIMALMSSEQGERIMSLLITKSMRSAVTTYVDATSGYNVYDDLLSSLAKPVHRDAVSDVMARVTGAFCKEVARAYSKASMQQASGSSRSSGGGSAPVMGSAGNGQRPRGSVSAAPASPAGNGASGAINSMLHVSHGSGSSMPQAADAAGSGNSSTNTSSGGAAEAAEPLSSSTRRVGSMGGGGGSTAGLGLPPRGSSSSSLDGVATTHGRPSSSSTSFSSSSTSAGPVALHASAAAGVAASSLASNARSNSLPTNVSLNGWLYASKLAVSGPRAISGGAGVGGKSQILSLQQHQQQLVMMTSPSTTSLSPWLKQLVELAKDAGVRSLTVDMISKGSREATKGFVEGLMQAGSAVGSCGEDERERLRSAAAGGQVSSVLRAAGVTAQASVAAVYLLLVLAVVMFMYTISPRTIIL